MKPKILVLYYTQSGQLKDILDNIINPIRNQAEITYAPIEPVTPFKMPWTTEGFFDCMPECVQEVPIDIQPMQIPDEDYDLVIFGYQPWFLSPSLPTTGFLKSEYARILKGKNVVTVVGARNMWLNAQEKVKNALSNLGAHLRGNIVLVDSNHNLVSLFTVIRWTFKGQKEASGMLPEAGVQTPDIHAAERFGPLLLQAAQRKQYDTLQAQLLDSKAVTLKPTLIVLEKRGITNFRKFAKFIREKGERGNPARRPRVKLFQRLLMMGIFVFSPISGITARLAALLRRKQFSSQLNYFKGVDFQPEVL
jgi:hypothetical protein